MSRELVKDHGTLMMLGSMRAEERVAAFLLNLIALFAKAWIFVVRARTAHDAR